MHTPVATAVIDTDSHVDAAMSEMLVLRLASMHFFAALGGLLLAAGLWSAAALGAFSVTAAAEVTNFAHDTAVIAVSLTIGCAIAVYATGRMSVIGRAPLLAIAVVATLFSILLVALVGLASLSAYSIKPRDAFDVVDKSDIVPTFLAVLALGALLIFLARSFYRAFRSHLRAIGAAPAKRRGMRALFPVGLLELASTSGARFSLAVLLWTLGSLLFVWGFYFATVRVVQAISGDGRSLMTLFVVPVYWAAGRFFHDRTKRQLVAGLSKAGPKDRRRPVLFLRSFGDDQVQLRNAHYGPINLFVQGALVPRTFDELLLSEGSVHGRVMAIGRPSDTASPYGAVRLYVGSEDWRSCVERVAAQASAIVICLDETAGVQWELECIVANQYVGKTLIIIPEKLRRTRKTHDLLRALTARLGAGAGAGLDQVLDRAEAAADGAEIVGFFQTGTGELRIFTSAQPGDLNYAIILRAFFSQRFRPAGAAEG